MEEIVCPSCNAVWLVLRWCYALPELSFDVRAEEPRRTVTLCAASCQNKLFCPCVQDLRCWLEACGVLNEEINKGVARARNSVNQQMVGDSLSHP